MAAAVGTQVSQDQTLGTVKADVGVNSSQLQVLTAINFPSHFTRVSQGAIVATVKHTVDAHVSQVQLYAVVRGRIENRRVRSWTFSLDGHDFYVLRLGDSYTLVYDLTTQQWSEWASPDITFWRPNTGMNWNGMGKASFNTEETNVVAGDDAFGLLWTLDPEQGYDEHPITGDAAELPFERKVVGGIPMRMRERLQNGAVYLTGSFAAPQITGASITLRTSDDYGKTWTSHGTITVDPGNYDQEFVWRSLGAVRAPGRIFEITDNGATVRIDSLDMR